MTSRRYIIILYLFNFHNYSRNQRSQPVGLWFHLSISYFFCQNCFHSSGKSTTMLEPERTKIIAGLCEVCHRRIVSLEPAKARKVMCSTLMAGVWLFVLCFYFKLTHISCRLIRILYLCSICSWVGKGSPAFFVQLHTPKATRVTVPIVLRVHYYLL
jgi:hypothetical protein